MPDGKVEFIYQEIMIGFLQGMVDRLSRPDYSVHKKARKKMNRKDDSHGPSVF